MLQFFFAFLMPILSVVHAQDQTCPNLGGRFMEDDYAYIIDQKSCNELFLNGEFLFTYHDYDIRRTDGIEHVCHSDDHSTKYCTAQWSNKELQIEIREVFNSPPGELKTFRNFARCDDMTPQCTYGDRQPSDVIRVIDDQGEHFIPRHSWGGEN